uniref:Uncharacterized protein n=1 Tax=Sphaerodactylus townsendi TaxID=933632 RepID=A0ACB8F2A5_9SAUR
MKKQLKRSKQPLQIKAQAAQSSPRPSPHPPTPRGFIRQDESSDTACSATLQPGQTAWLAPSSGSPACGVTQQPGHKPQTGTISGFSLAGCMTPTSFPDCKSKDAPDQPSGSTPSGLMG